MIKSSTVASVKVARRDSEAILGQDQGMDMAYDKNNSGNHLCARLNCGPYFTQRAF